MNLGIGLLHQRQPSLAFLVTRAKVKRPTEGLIVDLVKKLIVHHGRDPVAVLEKDESINAHILVLLHAELFQETRDVGDHGQGRNEPTVADGALKIKQDTIVFFRFGSLSIDPSVSKKKKDRKQLSVFSSKSPSLSVSLFFFFFLYLLDIIWTGAVQEKDWVPEQVWQASGTGDIVVDGLRDQGRVETVASIVQEIKL